MMRNTMKRLLGLLLALVLVLGMAAYVAPAAAAQPSDPFAAFEGKTLSILGDSISTYTDWSSGAAADTTNSTIRNGAVYYTAGNSYGVTQPDTWWQQTVDALGLRLLVNNSWSGSCVYKTRGAGGKETVGAYVDRCVQLHDDTGDNAGEEPDIIAVYLGTNDHNTYPTTVGKAAEVDYDTLITGSVGNWVYAEPTNTVEAYAIMLHKMMQRYPNAEIYCFTMLPFISGSSGPNSSVGNAELRAVAEHFNAVIVDLYNCGVSIAGDCYSYMMANELHPNSKGMDAITNCFLSALYKNSKYMDKDTEVYDVTYDLDGTFVREGEINAAVAGQPFTISFPERANYVLDLTVTMGGEDITDACYADGVISIPAVSGDIVITAAAGRKIPLNYHWEMRPSGLFGVASWGHSANILTREDASGSVSGGKLTGVIYSMDRAVTLYHDRPWVIEWESSGTWNNSPKGNMLFSCAETVTNSGEFYIYRRHNADFLIAFGEKVGSKWNNYGIRVNSWFTQQGLDPAASHVYRLYNKVGQDGNMVWLSINGIEVGPLNQVDVNGTGKGTTSDYLSGKNFVFNYMGTTSHPLDNCNIGWVKVWENGEPASDSTPAEYRFELGTDGLTASGGDYDKNGLALITGSYSGGTFNNAAYELEEALHLAHDYPWVVEWKSSGSWHGPQQGAMLFAEYNASDFIDAYYFYRRASDAGNPNFFGFGNRVGTKWYNYGLTRQVDNNSHVFRLTNKVAKDGSNMVWLSIDGVEIGPMNGYNVGGYDQGTTDNWASGKDFHFSFLGAGKHLINSCSIDYIHVQECSHSFVNGLCTACGADGAELTVEDDRVLISIPGLEAGAKVLVACYDGNDRLISCELHEEPVDERVSTSVAEGTVTVKAYAVDGDWVPVHPMITPTEQ